MKRESNSPNFISNVPCGEDKFKNKPHESVADVLYNLMTSDSSENNTLENKIIGLEGAWGSGKSNTLSILKNKLITKDYPIFNYDIWGHQEDLTRQSFLEEIIDWALTNKVKLKKNSKLNELSNQITAKYKSTETKFYPKVKIMYLWLVLIPLSNKLLTFIGKNLKQDIINPFYKTKIFITSLFAALALISLALNVKEYMSGNIEEYRKNLKKHSTRKCIIDGISSALYFLSGEQSESKLDEFVLEDEPSVKRFKSLFSEFLNSLDTNGIIIVFDNMDRLSSRDNLMSFWSSLNTFFSDLKLDSKDNKNDIKIYTVIPYDKKNLTKLMLGKNDVDNKLFIDEFINKTFFVSISVPTPLFDNWKHFFTEKVKSAFGKIITNKEITILETLISLKYEDVITPRLLINFINNLVVLWYRKSEIELKYLAFYSLFEDEIKANPSLMITLTGLDSFKINLNTFSDEEITKKLASLFYNISENSAKKVLYDKTAKTELRNKTDNFEILIKDPTFFIWFEDVVVRNTLADFDFKNLVEIYQVIEKSYPSSPFIISFSQKILDSIKKEDNYSVEMEWFIDSLKIEMQEKYFRKFYENLFEAEKINIDNYTLLLDKIFESSSKQSFNARFLSIKEQKINVSKFVELYFDRKETDKIDYFNYYNFVIDEEEVVKYFISNGIYKADKLNQLQIIEYLINEFSKFSGDLFNQSNQDMLKNVINSNNSSNSKELIETVLRVNRWFSKGSINKLNNAQQIYTRYKAYGGDATTNADIIGIILSYLVGTNIVPSVPDIKEISTISKDNTLIILKYVNLQIILKLLVKYNIPVLKTLINNIIEFDIYEEIDSTMVFNNIKAIHKHLGSNIFKLLKYFDQFSEDFSGKKYAHLDDWEDLITEEYIATYKCIEFVYDYYINLFTKYENQDWEDVFSNKKEIYTIFKQLLRKNLIDLNIINNIKFYGAIREIINKYIDNELDIDVDLFYLIMGKLNKPSLNFIVPKIYNYANNSSYTQFKPEKRKFIFTCVLNNNSKIEKKSLLIHNYFLQILNDDPEFINERMEDSSFVKSLSLFVRDYKKDYEVEPLIQSINNLGDSRYRQLLDILE